MTEPTIMAFNPSTTPEKKKPERPQDSQMIKEFAKWHQDLVAVLYRDTGSPDVPERDRSLERRFRSSSQ